MGFVDSVEFLCLVLPEVVFFLPMPPSLFFSDIIVPLIKDKNGNISSSDNYRPLALYWGGEVCTIVIVDFGVGLEMIIR